MTAAARYAFFHARVSLLAARLLPNERLVTLIEASQDQEREILQAAGLVQLTVETDLITLEQALITSQIAELASLVRSLSGTGRDFFIYWAHRFELSNLKAIIRAKMANQPISALREQLVDISPYTTLPVEELLNTEDITELLRRLEMTPGYVDIARQARQIFAERHELFALDAVLDRRYYAGLSQRAQRVEGMSGRYLGMLVGSLIDRINLVWLLRYRFAYRLSPAEAYYLLIPASYRLNRRQLLALAELSSLEEALRKLPAPFATLAKEAKTINDITAILRQRTWQLAEAILKRSVFNLARGFAYLLLRDRELRCLRAVLKGKRLAIAPRLIRFASGLETGDEKDGMTWWASEQRLTGKEISGV